MKNPENLEISEEVIVKDTEKLKEFKDLKRNDCKIY